MQELITICIPTYKRSEILREALDSCFAQNYPTFQIEIGDDSPDLKTEAVVKEYETRYPGSIHYKRNTPSLVQAANVNDLFRRADGERLLLLHDDDVLLPHALERLAACWAEFPHLTAAFGKQHILDHAGSVRSEASESLNRQYQRTSERAGLQPVPAIAGVSRMFPNDGYLVLSSLARQIGYRPPAEVRHACDTDFGVRLCAAAAAIYFVDEYLVGYRISKDALTKWATPEAHAYSSIAEAKLPDAANEARQRALHELAPAAVSAFALLGEPLRAWKILLSSSYGLRRWLHPRAAYHLYLILRASVSRPAHR